MWIILAAACLILVTSWIIDVNRFVVRHYEVRSPKVKRDYRFALIADLHNKEYDKGNASLLDALDRERPDAVLIAGDVLTGVPGRDFTVATELIRNLSMRCPVYYGMGNHEYRMKIYSERFETMWNDYAAELAKCGVHVMDNERVLIPDAGIEIVGLSIGARFYKKFVGRRMSASDVEDCVGEPDGERMTLLIAHDPDHFKAYSEWGADLTVSGHVHGGVMRLPLLGGVISPKLRLFPKYSGGEYSLNGSRMIVSCGLGMHTINVRIFNPGELGIIDVRRG